jgi:hypothetical protein
MIATAKRIFFFILRILLSPSTIYTKIPPDIMDVFLGDAMFFSKLFLTADDADLHRFF